MPANLFTTAFTAAVAAAFTDFFCFVTSALFSVAAVFSATAERVLLRGGALILLVSYEKYLLYKSHRIRKDSRRLYYFGLYLPDLALLKGILQFLLEPL
jgi:hypothetical protein